MPHNETTIKNGKQIILTSEEKTKVDEFHKSRIAFAFLNDGRCAINVKDVREHKTYLQEDFGISFDEFENLTRGYIKPGRIVFYKTSGFIPIESITEKVLSIVSEKALENMKFGMVLKSESLVKNGNLYKKKDLFLWAKK